MLGISTFGISFLTQSIENLGKNIAFSVHCDTRITGIHRLIEHSRSQYNRAFGLFVLVL
jgi:hypothetical protein